MSHLHRRLVVIVAIVVTFLTLTSQVSANAAHKSNQHSSIKAQNYSAFCAGHKLYADCLRFQDTAAKCAWCGFKDQTPPISQCYSANPETGEYCCERGKKDAQNDPTICVSSANICHNGQACKKWGDESTYGVCNQTVCCEAGQDVCPGGNCYNSTNEQCCRSAYRSFTCDKSKGEFCCSAFEALCCSKGSSCCESPDGYSNWCCEAGTQCNINGYCDKVV